MNGGVRKWIAAMMLICLCAACGFAMADEVRVMSAEAANWIVGKDPTAYTPWRMIDGFENTAFQFSLKKMPLNQAYVYFHFAAPSEINRLWIKNGFWRVTDGKDQYLRNSRVKTMRVEFCYDGTQTYADGQTVTLADERPSSGWTMISLGEHENVTSIRFLIQEVYSGSKYPNDVCISEVKFFGGEGSAYAQDLYGLTIDKLSTRNGPGTTYTETGTYSVKGEYIWVLSRAWDARNGIWWVRCVIPYRNEYRILWTGYKRFDSSTLPLESIPIEYVTP